MPEIAPLSPLAGHAFADLPELAITERPFASLVQIAAWPDTIGHIDSALSRDGLPTMPGPRGSREQGTTVAIDAGPGRAYLMSGETDLGARLEALVPPEIGSVTDLGHARVCLRLSGSRAAWVLAKGVAIDLHHSAFPVGTCVWTQVDHVGIILRRAEADAFDILVYRGFAASLVHWLETAGLPDVVAA